MEAIKESFHFTIAFVSLLLIDLSIALPKRTEGAEGYFLKDI